MRQISKFLIALLVFGPLSALAQSKPGKDTIGDIPLQWDVDLYHELRTNFPNLKNESVVFLDVENHRVSFPGRNGKNDSQSYRSENEQLTVKSIGDSSSRSFDPAPPKPKKDQPPPKVPFVRKPYLGRPGDVISLAYNQQVKIYVPSADKFVWLAPKRDGIKVYPITEPKADDIAWVKSIQTGQATSGSAVAAPAPAVAPVRRGR